jgi:hypothetical protein
LVEKDKDADVEIVKGSSFVAELIAEPVRGS